MPPVPPCIGGVYGGRALRRIRLPQAAFRGNVRAGSCTSARRVIRSPESISWLRVEAPNEWRRPRWPGNASVGRPDRRWKARARPFLSLRAKHVWSQSQRRRTSPGHSASTGAEPNGTGAKGRQITSGYSPFVDLPPERRRGTYPSEPSVARSTATSSSSRDWSMTCCGSWIASRRWCGSSPNPSHSVGPPGSDARRADTPPTSCLSTLMAT